ncbi:mechanosensitive ion channel family protein [Hydrogenophaga sp. RAC07]|uniref:mechanosensitive ion channel family protein n=1 Tax=Hydrogenophaga sp. RAC07 TaxID=1842537 RepID=UPI00083CAB4B|nr:mechanosensitive ion channel family protein [Hydrogenophaga sp. RAC07]AOF85955.1 mechanosensitive ion channel family protein [Hydrogenophaga sp. RAC07]
MNDTLIETAARWWASLGGAATTLLRVTLIMVAAWVLIAVLQRGIRTLRERIASRMDDRESTKRAETLGRVFRYLATVVVSLIAVMLVLAELGVSVAPILGAAGVVGLAVGFGAQSLVKDFFTGFFILLENQIRQGDVVKLGDHAGMVEVVTLRYVQLRDYDGNVHYVPNGHISTVINMTRGFSNAVMDIGVAYRENVDEVMTVMRQVAVDLQKDPAFELKILAELEIAGVESLADSAVVIRCRFRTLPLEQWGVKREYLRRVKAAFDEHGIEIPYPHMTVYAGQDREGKAPAFALKQLTEA